MDSVQRTAFSGQEKEWKTRTFKDLIVWKKSYQLVLEVYKLTKDFPKEEIYGLVQQMRKAVVSIPANIVEGYGRQSKKNTDNFWPLLTDRVVNLRLSICCLWTWVMPAKT